MRWSTPFLGIVNFLTMIVLSQIISLYIFLCKYFCSCVLNALNLLRSLSVGRTFPYHKLSPVRPPTSLIGISQFSSILLQLGLVAIFQFATVIYLHSQPWFKPHVGLNGTEIEESENADYVCHDNYAVSQALGGGHLLS